MNKTDKVYQDLLQNILDNGTRKGDRTGTGTISIPHAAVEFDMQEGFPLLTTKKMFTKGVIHELLWFLNGDTNIKYLVDNGVNIWTPDAYREYKNQPQFLGHEDIPDIEWFKAEIKSNDKFAENFGQLGPVYGKQWVDWGGKTGVELTDNRDENGYLKYEPVVLEKGINQIKNAVDKLLNKPDDRRNIVSAWNIEEIDDMALPPCHYDFHLYTEEMGIDERMHYWFHNSKPNRDVCDAVDELEEEAKYSKLTEYGVPERRVSLIWDQRSVDTFLGLPFNIASYGILLHMFAQQANMIPDKLVGHLKNVHIYTNHVDQCKEQISREPKALPKLNLNKADDIFSYSYEDIKFEDYDPHPTIKGAISV